MILVLDIASSLGFWREHYPLSRAPKNPLSLPRDEYAYRQTDAFAIASTSPHFESLVRDGVLSTLAFSDNHRLRSNSHVSHLWSGPIPPGSFYELQPGVFVESPEFMFLRAASILNHTQLIAFGDELCGLYSFDAHEERGFRKREVPLCTKSQLEWYIATAKACRGQELATRALVHIVNKSASPMETYDEMAISLPYRIGGYNFSQPEMNRKIQLTPQAARIAKRHNCYLDMSWDGVLLDVEHHGKHDHSSEQAVMDDRARVNALKEMGYEVIELTNSQVDDPIAFELIVRRIARMLNKRIRDRYFGLTEARAKLYSDVRAWNASYGAILH